LAQILEEKVSTIILHNERIMVKILKKDAKFGNYGFGDMGDKEIIE
jgi:hypothetical protein